MKTTVNKPVEIEIKHVALALPILYGDEDIPNDFPLRIGNDWHAVVEIDTGRILDWPAGKSGEFQQKQGDTGTYRLLAPDGKEVARIEDAYVPHGVVPGDYGDYIELHINEAGVITNWPKDPNVSAFFKEEDE